MKGIDGTATGRRVGTDALTPSFAKLLPMAFPNAELVDGELAMRAPGHWSVGPAREGLLVEGAVDARTSV